MAPYPESELVINGDGSVYHLNLKPEHLTTKIITVGDPGRVHRVSQHFDDIEFEMNKREFITHVGKYKGKPLTVMSTGMGTDNIEILMIELDALVNIDLKKRVPKAEKTTLEIVRLGTSGSLQEDVPLGSHLVSDYGIGTDSIMHFYEMDYTPFEQEMADNLMQEVTLPYKPYVVQGSTTLRDRIGHDMIKGNTITAPGFYAPQGREIRIPTRYPDMVKQMNYFHHKDFWLTNFEMETAGYYALGRMLGHEMLSVNAIVANRIKGEFAKNAGSVVDSLIEKVLDRI